MARRTKETYSGSTMQMVTAIESSGKAPELPERYTNEGIEERREHVWKFLARRVPQTVMAKILGVSRRTIASDVKFLKEQCKDFSHAIKNDPEAACMDIGLTALRLEGIAQAAMGDYELARTAQHKNLFLNTAIKAETARSSLLINTGVLPKAGEDVRVTHNLKATFAATMGEESPLSTLDQPDSRRKVLSAAKKILALSADRQNVKRLETFDVEAIDKSE